jgi:hypothetical protein
MEQTKDLILSETTKEMEESQICYQKNEVNHMTGEELKTFRNSFNSDDMGFFGQEGV